MYKKLLFIIIIIPLILSGCWGKKELGDISIVRTIGIDVEPNGDIRVTVLAEEPTGVKGGEQGMRSSTAIITSTGSNIKLAMKQLSARSSKQPLLVHSNIIIISEDAADEVLDEILDFLIRNKNIRLDNNVLISKTRAIDLLQFPAKVQGSLHENIMGIIENSKYLSRIYVADLRTFTLQYIDKHISPVTAKIDFYETPLLTVSVGREAYEMMKSGTQEVGVLFIDGCATIKENGKIGTLNYNETQGYLWIMDKVKGAVIEIPGLDGSGKIVMMNIGSNIKKKVQVNDGNASIMIDLEVNGDLGVNTSKDNFDKDEVVKEVEKIIAKKIEDHMKQAVKKSQKDFKTDIFGFSQLIYRSEPGIWKEIEAKWNEMYQDLEVKYNVECTIKQMGMLNESLTE